jgi:hypothetical protein
MRDSRQGGAAWQTAAQFETRLQRRPRRRGGSAARAEPGANAAMGPVARQRGAGTQFCAVASLGVCSGRGRTAGSDLGHWIGGRPAGESD